MSATLTVASAAQSVLGDQAASRDQPANLPYPFQHSQGLLARIFKQLLLSQQTQAAGQVRAGEVGVAFFCDLMLAVVAACSEFFAAPAM